ncbi:MAG: ABC transporter ATP-binding protein [Bacteroidetes bacterium]|nr:ABC transporter ATP-binding protein [Bacteroidota bacterium]
MRNFFSVLKYAKSYKTYTGLNILFNVLFALLSVMSLALIAPFLDLLFKSQDENLLLIVLKGKPNFNFTSSYLKEISDYYLAGLILSKGKAGALLLICILVFVLSFLKNVARYMAMYFVAPIRNGVVRDLRNKMYNKALQLPLSYYSNEKKGDLMSRMSTDVLEIEWGIMQTLEMIFREPLTIIIVFSLMLLISAKLTIYILILLPIAAIAIALIGKSLKNTSKKSKETLGLLISLIEETLGSLKVIKAFSAEDFLNKKFNTLNKKFYTESLSVYRKTDLGSPLTETIVTAILMLILFLGGRMVFNGEITGALFITYFAMASQLIPPFKQITVSYNNIQKGLASEERIEKVLHADNLIFEKEKTTNIECFKSHIEFKNLSFAYTKGDNGYVLKDINITIQKGKTIALVGQSGSGKTTLADMLPRFYDSNVGAVLIDDIDVKDMKFSSLRKMIGIVTQESVLFNESVSYNIGFGLPNVTEQQIINAAKIANAHQFISEMPQGYNTTVGDRGSKLSGGQKQRLSIARAVLKNPDILILDEATSALDTESEKLVQEALADLMKNRTSIVIAHRLSTIVNADEIIVLEKGMIAERGNHKSLIEKNGIYKKLCDMQSFT